MSILKYKYPIIVIIIIIIVPITWIFMMKGDGFTNLIIIDHLGFQLSFIFFMIAINSIIGGFLMGYVLSPMYLTIHKKIVGRKMIYGIQDKPKPKKFTGTFKPLLPALMAINFSMMLLSIPELVDMITANQTESEIIFITLSLTITIAIAMAIVSPTWFLADAGIIYTNKEIVEGTIDPVEVRSVGKWYLGFLKGYAGIGVIFSFYTFIINYSYLGIGVILLAVFPFLITCYALPNMLLLDITRRHRRKFILKRAKKLGIVGDIINIEITRDSNAVNKNE